MTTVPTLDVPPLATSRYQAFQPADGLAIRATVFPPRFPLSYKVVGSWKTIAPEPEWLRLNDERFAGRYFHKLDTLGLDNVLAEPRAIAAKHPGATLVGLCFCDVSDPDPIRQTLCHRSLLSGWLGEHGIVVPELTRPDDRLRCRAGWVDPPALRVCPDCPSETTHPRPSAAYCMQETS